MWLPRGYSLVALKAYPWEGCLKLKCATERRASAIGLQAILLGQT